LEIEDASNLDPNVKVSEFICNKQWNLEKLRLTVQNHLVLQQILSIALPVIETGDSFCWGLNGSGEFTTKSATWLADGNEIVQRQPWPYKWIWSINTMPKIKIFLWQVCHNALPVRVILFRRGCHIEPECPLFQMDMESIDHLFWTCHETQRV